MFSELKINDIVMGAGINYGHVMKVTEISDGFVRMESAAGMWETDRGNRAPREIVASTGPFAYAGLYSDATEAIRYGGQEWQARRPESLAGHDYRAADYSYWGIV